MKTRANRSTSSNNSNLTSNSSAVDSGFELLPKNRTASSTCYLNNEKTAITESEIKIELTIKSEDETISTLNSSAVVVKSENESFTMLNSSTGGLKSEDETFSTLNSSTALNICSKPFSTSNSPAVVLKSENESFMTLNSSANGLKSGDPFSTLNSSTAFDSYSKPFTRNHNVEKSVNSIIDSTTIEPEIKTEPLIKSDDEIFSRSTSPLSDDVITVDTENGVEKCNVSEEKKGFSLY